MKAFKHPSDSAAHEIYLKYSKYTGGKLHFLWLVWEKEAVSL
jgi:hypothetical protein